MTLCNAVILGTGVAVVSACVIRGVDPGNFSSNIVDCASNAAASANFLISGYLWSGRSSCQTYEAAFCGFGWILCGLGGLWSLKLLLDDFRGLRSDPDAEAFLSAFLVVLNSILQLYTMRDLIQGAWKFALEPNVASSELEAWGSVSNV